MQYSLLVDTMVAKPEFAAGRFVGLHGKYKLSAFWSNLVTELNDAGPPKTLVQWQKVSCSINFIKKYSTLCPASVI